MVLKAPSKALWDMHQFMDYYPQFFILITFLKIFIYELYHIMCLYSQSLLYKFPYCMTSRQSISARTSIASKTFYSQNVHVRKKKFGNFFCRSLQFSVEFVFHFISIILLWELCPDFILIIFAGVPNSLDKKLINSMFALLFSGGSFR